MTTSPFLMSLFAKSPRNPVSGDLSILALLCTPPLTTRVCLMLHTCRHTSEAQRILGLILYLPTVRQDPVNDLMC